MYFTNFCVLSGDITVPFVVVNCPMFGTISSVTLNPNSEARLGVLFAYLFDLAPVI